MTDRLPPLPQAELTLRALLRRELEPADPGQVGRDLLGEPPEPWYVRIIKTPGGGANNIQGSAVVDIEVFAGDYLSADSLGSTIGDILLGYPHVVEVDGQIVVIDSVSQNVPPHEIFWEDETVSRILATYVITWRR